MQLRGVGYSQFHQHLSNIRKVQTFLGTLNPDSPALLTHLERLQPWLSTLSTQLEHQLPKAIKTPTHWDLIKQFTDLLVGECKVVLDQPPVMITKTQAFFIQSVIQTIIFVGRYTPPLRAGVVRDLMHPSQVARLGCQDPDCKAKGSCPGNRLEVEVGADGQRRARVQALHHKTEGARNEMSNGPISFLLPPCPLNDLLLWWLDKGWHLVRQGYTKGDPAPTVFSSSYLQSYSCSTLSQWWTHFKSVHSPKSLKIGSITECRSSFIEAFTDKFRDDESKWVRAAAIMGNSIEAWKKHYAVTLKRRRCQEGIDAFASEFLLEDVVREEHEEMALVSMELPPCRVLSSLLQPRSVCKSVSHGVPVPLGVVDVCGDEFGPW